MIQALTRPRSADDSKCDRRSARWSALSASLHDRALEPATARRGSTAPLVGVMRSSALGVSHWFRNQESGRVCDMAGTSQRGPGRPGNGDRVQKTMRFPDVAYSVYQEAAEELGLDFNAYVNWVLARQHCIAPPEWAEPASSDRGEQLRLEGAA